MFMGYMQVSVVVCGFGRRQGFRVLGSAEADRFVKGLVRGPSGFSGIG